MSVYFNHKSNSVSKPSPLYHGTSQTDCARYISPTQVRASRAILDWSQDKLADTAGISRTTIHGFELGFIPRQGTVERICSTLENAGIEFTDADGVKRRIHAFRCYQGNDGAEHFFEDAFHDVRVNGDEIFLAFRSTTEITESCFFRNGNLGLLDRASKIAPIKCLVPEMLDPDLLGSSFQFRLLPPKNIGAASYIVHGNCQTVVLDDGNGTYRYCSYNMPELAVLHRQHFLALWDTAQPVIVASSKNKK